ncbi:ABC transporter ATP-binding protein [Egibacter rhizosphaerae]|uniref:ABC transporter ATP-binding protein n=1 Tax=Egibacter rhizosphaerae TaxID=1670831 RepID=A0A411YFP5_9ACTN|nr:dipeptide/oligopeptide/nickel ABC transporter ATP-binding protein [Egibacter rhizosphaerae]QBI19937.1 ABC transporter ATP-binding protein [Egibacter rhizosphaerae]
MLTAEAITCRYGRGPGAVTALSDVSLRLEPGMRLGLTGPSGSGKSTLARVLALLYAPDVGCVIVDGVPVPRAGTAAPRWLRRRVQLLWQSPRAATDPRATLRHVVGEPAALVGDDPAPVVEHWAPRVGLSAELLGRHPHEVSDGQLQRACLARALACEPGYLVADEATAMLDVSTQAALLEVIAQVQDDHGMGVLLLTHDRAVARHWCGEVVPIDELTSAPERG